MLTVTGLFGPDITMSVCSEDSFDRTSSHTLFCHSSAWHLLLHQELLSGLLPVASVNAVPEAAFEVFLYYPAL